MLYGLFDHAKCHVISVNRQKVRLDCRLIPFITSVIVFFLPEGVKKDSMKIPNSETIGASLSEYECTVCTS